MTKLPISWIFDLVALIDIVINGIRVDGKLRSEKAARLSIAAFLTFMAGKKPKTKYLRRLIEAIRRLDDETKDKSLTTRSSQLADVYDRILGVAGDDDMEPRLKKLIDRLDQSIGHLIEEYHVVDQLITIRIRSKKLTGLDDSTRLEWISILEDINVLFESIDLTDLRYWNSEHGRYPLHLTRWIDSIGLRLI